MNTVTKVGTNNLLNLPKRKRSKTQTLTPNLQNGGSQLLFAQIDVNTDICLQLFINMEMVGEDDTRKTKQHAIIVAKRR